MKITSSSSSCCWWPHGRSRTALGAARPADLLLLRLLAAALLAITSLADAQKGLLDGSWEGTEVRIFDPQGACATDAPPLCTAVARLSLKAGAGTYTTGGELEVEPNELLNDGSFAAGHIKAGANMVGTFEAQANATHLWGSWATYGDMRHAHLPVADASQRTTLGSDQELLQPHDVRCMHRSG